MAIHRSTNEKFQIVQEYYNSGLNVRQFSKSIGIAPSTLHDWLRKVEDNLEQDTSTSLANNSFISITNPVKASSIEASKEVKLTIPNVGVLEFDIKNLKDILEVFK